MGYFETKYGIIVGDQQADIIDKVIGDKTFTEVMKDKVLCADLYDKVKGDFMGHIMTKKEFVGLIAFCTGSTGDYAEEIKA